MPTDQVTPSSENGGLGHKSLMFGSATIARQRRPAYTSATRLFADVSAIA
jgi:hypothetical protein